MWFLSGVWHGYDVAFFTGLVLLSVNPEVANDLQISASVITPANNLDLAYCHYWLDLLSNFVKYG